MTCLYRLLAILIPLLAISASTISAAAQDATLAPMELGQEIVLPFVPSHVMFRPGKTQFFVSGDYDPVTQKTRILGYDAEDRSQEFEFTVQHAIDAMVFSVTGDRLFVVGGKDGEGYVSAFVLGPDAAPGSGAAKVKLAHLPVHASIAVDSQTVYVGDATSDRVFKIPSAVFGRERQSSDFDSTNVISSTYAPGAVHALGVSDGLRLAFVSSEMLPKVWAIQLDGPERVIDEYAQPTTTGSAYSGPFPMAFLMTSRNVETKGAPGVSFLIADHVTSSISVVDYDPLFRTMDVVTTAAAGNHLDPGTVVQVDPDTKLIKQPMLLGSDDRQRTILVGDLYSRQLVQFSRSAMSTSLERVGELELSTAPVSLAVSGDGSVAVVAIAGSPNLQILTSSNTVTPPSPTEQDTKIRELQRALTELGLDVGAVDGVRGSTTDRALQVFQQATGTTLPPGDVDAAMRAVTQLRAECPTSGLACLKRSR